MEPIVHELGRQVLGQVTANQATRDYFSTDGSVFTLTPSVVIYPKSEQDVVNTVRFFGDKLRNEKIRIGITARGKGTDQGGGSLGTGAILAFPGGMNHLIKYSATTVTIQPGMIYGSLQKILHSHGRFLPPYPASVEFATIGGAVANNSAGEKTVKYGSTRNYVKSLRVVLSDGSTIVTSRLNKKQLKAKKKLSTLEGYIYREIDTLIEDNKVIISSTTPKVTKNSAGYALANVKRKDGSFDLGQLIVGSQGTLGIVTEITLNHVAWNKHTHLLMGFFDSIEKATDAVLQITKLDPSALEVVDYNLLKFLREHKPEQIEGLVPEKLPQIGLLVEFDDPSRAIRTRKAHRVTKIFNELAYAMSQSTNPVEQDAMWEVRRGAAAVIWMVDGAKKALPIIEDGVVPVTKMPEFMEAVYKLFKKYKIEIAIWGHAGNANFHMQPFLNIGSATDRKKAFALMDEFYATVIRMGGSTCGEHNDGILRAPYLKSLYGEQMYELFTQVKSIFDPENLLNPDVKIGVTKRFAASHLRKEYSMKHLHDFWSSVHKR